MSRPRETTIYEVWRYNEGKQHVLLEKFNRRHDAMLYASNQSSRHAFLIIPTKVKL